MPRLSEAELADRHLYMGSTDVTEVNGLSPWRGAGPMRCFNEKLGIVSADDAEEDGEQEWLEWGAVMEPVIADWYEREYDCKLLPAGRVVSREHPWLMATLDAVVLGQGRGLEIKNVGSPKLYGHWSTADEDGVPMYVRAQVTIAMHCHGTREWDVVASIGGRPPHVWRVWYDAELAEMLIARAAEFWQLVQAKTPPPLDWTPASKAYLLDRYPRNLDPVMREADAATDELGQARLAASLAEKQGKREKDRLDAELLSRVGEADGIEGSGWKISWKCDRYGKRKQRFTATRERE